MSCGRLQGSVSAAQLHGATPPFINGLPMGLEEQSLLLFLIYYLSVAARLRLTGEERRVQ